MKFFTEYPKVKFKYPKHPKYIPTDKKPSWDWGKSKPGRKPKRRYGRFSKSFRDNILAKLRLPKKEKYHQI